MLLQTAQSPPSARFQWLCHHLVIWDTCSTIVSYSCYLLPVIGLILSEKQLLPKVLEYNYGWMLSMSLWYSFTLAVTAPPLYQPKLCCSYLKIELMMSRFSIFISQVIQASNASPSLWLYCFCCFFSNSCIGYWLTVLNNCWSVHACMICDHATPPPIINFIALKFWH